ncbi:Ku protein [Candidatus Formimonas warabiya]|uniref:Non-homologous end joining protein Ku n=1 Tax=Formimonas warabiya TaxID=1761012 RepID=A0A3G1KMK6_FORW1|nr:Ku protein [Candidatus Formimonas warabiya]ATW23677.1 Ku protein [Candidatus Formimonas warabiya]
MRTIWKGAISFGLVNIPVKLFPATESKTIKFNYLHKECHSPINYQKLCPVCNREVSQDEIVRGYEYEKGRFVILNEEDMDNLPTATTKTVDIIDFVDLSEIDPIYFSKPYYLAPSEGGQKAYLLLKEAMKETGKIAIAKVTIRSTENLVCLRVYENTVLMETMYYPDEIRSGQALPELNAPVPLHENEIKMATQLINNLSARFDPAKYKSDYREALMQLIEAKVAGEQIETPQVREPGNVVDLMEALKASLKATENEKNLEKKPRVKKKAAK